MLPDSNCVPGSAPWQLLGLLSAVSSAFALGCSRCISAHLISAALSCTRIEKRRSALAQFPLLVSTLLFKMPLPTLNGHRPTLQVCAPPLSMVSLSLPLPLLLAGAPHDTHLSLAGAPHDTLLLAGAPHALSLSLMILAGAPHTCMSCRCPHDACPTIHAPHACPSCRTSGAPANIHKSLPPTGA